MEVIDRYVYAVIKRLPEKSRAEVERELRSNIDDMLPEPCEEADVHRVLLSLGNPAEMAEQYRENKRYVISPGLYGNYIYVLKIVSIIAGLAIPVAAFVSVLTDAQGDGPFELLVRVLVESIVMAFQAVLPVFGGVTLIFALLERADKKYSQWPYTGKPWTIKDLNEAPASHPRSIAKSESIFSIVVGIVFGIAISFYPELLGWYSNVNGDWSVVPVFNESELRPYVPFLLALTAFSVVLATLKLIQQKWTAHLAWLNLLFNVCNIAFVCAFLLNSAIFSDIFISTFATEVEADLDAFKNGWETGTYVLAAFTSVAMAWDGIHGLIKARK
ncbi:hypothetical protein [Cohnella sp. GCM10027633]|uniref:hypothetical protein n=1 Tax=unclassified Cohnella TaxID=2636738 RepID=UPI003635C986